MYASLICEWETMLSEVAWRWCVCTSSISAHANLGERTEIQAEGQLGLAAAMHQSSLTISYKASTTAGLLSMMQGGQH
jgi:hypothetical protein